MIIRSPVYASGGVNSSHEDGAAEDGFGESKESSDASTSGSWHGLRSGAPGIGISEYMRRSG